MSEEPWLDFYTATQEIQQRLGMSRGGAQKTLRELCRTGEVRSQKQPYTMVNREPQTEGPTERIQPSEWRGLEVDLMTDADGCRYFVEVSENDFRHWLDQQQSPTGATGKKPLIIRHLAKMFSNQRVPEPAFCNRKKLLNDLIKLESGFGGKLDEQTLKTAVDEYNRSIRTNPNRTASD